jgi:HlyD family secretion protein
MALSGRKLVVVLALGLAGVVAGLAALLLTTGAQAPTAAPRSAAQESRSWQAVAPGRVEPRSGEVRVGSVALGRIGAVLVKVNDVVLPGEPLIRIDDDQVRTRLAKVTAEVNLRKRARPAQAKGSDRRKLEDAAADAEQAVVDAQAAVDRAAIARRNGTGSEDVLAAARSRLTGSQEQSKQRQAELAKFEADAPATVPTELEGQLAMARIELRGAEAALDSLTIRAPIAGTVLQVNARAGEVASPSATQPLLVLGDISALRVRAELDERRFGEIRIGQPVVVRSDAFRGRDIAGKVASIAPMIEPGRAGARQQRNMVDVNVAEVMVDLAEPGPLASGMKVDVYFADAAPTH